MKILVLAIGKTDEAYLDEGMKKYLKRLVRYTKVEFKILPDPANRKSLTPDLQKKAESELILAALERSDELILLDENGNSFGSRAFASWLEKKALDSVKRMVFVVGGPYGFSDELKTRATSLISLSGMTFSHQLVRLIFFEQLYRAFTIIKGEPYHHD
jgi:23S rRNA (pseudouridine1915-N3)-methyltransferase